MKFVALLFGFSLAVNAVAASTEAKPNLDGQIFTRNQFTGAMTAVPKEEVIPGILYLNQEDKASWRYHVYLQAPGTREKMWWLVGGPTVVRVEQFGVKFTEAEHQGKLKLNVDYEQKKLEWGWAPKNADEFITLVGSPHTLAYDEPTKKWGWAQVQVVARKRRTKSQPLNNYSKHDLTTVRPPGILDQDPFQGLWQQWGRPDFSPR